MDLITEAVGVQKDNKYLSIIRMRLFDSLKVGINFSTNVKHLSLVLENLLSNAAKFAQEGCITLKLERRDEGIRIQVRDTGCGIPLDKQVEVFERFAKLDSFTQGNGLGLFLCRLIISRLNGNICVDSSYTGGACFVISLPIL